MMTSQPIRTGSPRARLGLIAATVLLGALIGALLAKVAAPGGSTAETRLVVGDQTLSAQAVPGYSLATQQLATTYARLVSSDEVAQTVKGDVKSIEATPIASSAIIRVEATAGDDATALAAARAGGRRLIAISNQSRKADAYTGTMAKYNATYRTFQAANRALSAAKAKNDQSAIEAAQRRVAQTQLNLNSYSALYQEQMSSNGSGTSSVTTITKPAIVKQQAMRLPLLGALLGAFLVAALWALWAMLQRTRRAATAGGAGTATGRTRATGGRDDDREDSITLPDSGSGTHRFKPFKTSGTGRQ